jgi:hypothetical protein
MWKEQGFVDHCMAQVDAHRWLGEHHRVDK